MTNRWQIDENPIPKGCENHVSENAAKIAKKAYKNNTTLKEEAIKSGLITEKDFIKIVDPMKMTKPSR